MDVGFGDDEAGLIDPSNYYSAFNVEVVSEFRPDPLSRSGH